MTALVSIAIAAYNAEDTVGRAIESSLAQDWPNIEIVVVDDCSTDGTWKVLQDYGRRDSRISVFRQVSNIGVAGVRNRLVAEARGEFICFLDDDDWSAPRRVTEQYRRLTDYEAGHGVTAFCYCGRYVASGGRKFLAPNPIGSRSPEPYGEAVLDAVFGIPSALAVEARGPMGCGTLMVRKLTLQTIGKFDQQFRRAEEMDLAARAAFNGTHFISVEKPLIIQNKTEGAEKTGRKPLEYEILLRKKHQNYLRSRKLYYASISFAAAKFWGSKRRKFRSRAYRILGYAFAPHLIIGMLARRVDKFSR